MPTKEQWDGLAEAFARAADEIDARLAALMRAWNRAVEKANQNPPVDPPEEETT